ncbi:MAG: hypothetical protein R3B90_12685 [Planctomycetaceae bacterium]
MSPTPQDPANADELRRRMASIRRQLPGDVERIVIGARRAVDWRRYVAEHPWTATAVAALLGYWVIPKRPRVIQPSADELIKLAKKHQLTVQPQTVAQRQPGFVDTAVSMMGNMLFRAGVAYASQQFGKIVGQSTAASSEPQTLTGVEAT